MRVRFVLDGAADRAEVRWTLGQIAPLLDLRWAIGGAAGAEGEAEVWVGDPARAPAAAGAVIPLHDWPAWDPAALGVGSFDRAPLVCPGGACPPPAADRELPAPWLRSLFFLLSREEEGLDPRRDQWECYSGAFTRLRDLGVLGRPLVHLHAAQLRARLDAAARARGRELPREPRWPRGARFAAALTHDVDDVRRHSLAQAWRLLRQAPRSYAVRGGLTALRHALARPAADPYSRFERWTGEAERRGFRSTFYVFARPARRHEYDALYTLSDRLAFGGRTVRVAEMLRELRGRGFEIGLHGSYLSHRSAPALAAEKREVERAVGGPVTGVRQHFLRFDRGTTWAAQEAAGFTHDATLGYNETPGFRAGIAAPFQPWDAARGAGHRLTAVPLTLMDGALFRGLGLAPPAALAATLAHLDEVEAVGGMAGLLWHPNVVAEDLYPGWWDCFTAALDRLEQRGAWVAPAGEIAAWWRERSLRLEGNPVPA